MHTAIVLDNEKFDRLVESKGFDTANAAADSLGISPSFYQQVRSGVRGVSLLFVSRVFSQWGVPFTPGEEDSIYKFTQEEQEFQNFEENLI